MCSVASLGVDDKGCSGRLGLLKNLKPLQHDFIHFSNVLGEMHQFLGVFGHYGAPVGFADMFRSLFGGGQHEMKRVIGSGREFRAAAT